MKILKPLLAAACFVFIFGILAINGQKSDVSFSGVVEQTIFEGTPSRSEFFLISDNGNRYRLSDSKALAAYTNRRVSLSGAVAGNQLNIKSDIRVSDDKSGLTAPPTFGSRRVLVLLVKFSNTPTPTENVDLARANIFTGERSVNNFVKEASLNRYNLTGITRPDGDIAGWLTLPFPWQDCGDYGQWADDADALARESGYEPNNYNSVIYVFSPLCGNPRATLADLGSASRQRIWLGTGHLYNSEVMTHELGHNLGLYHANAVHCPNLFDCPAEEYGDPYDVMGSGRGEDLSFFFNNNYRLNLGWLTGRAPEITASGDYQLVAPSAPSKGNQVLQIPLKSSNGELTGISYFLEFRRPYSYDKLLFPAFQPLFGGVGIRYAAADPSWAYTRLVDSTPNTATFVDAPLSVGSTFNDPLYGVTITTLSANPQYGARVRIQLSR